MTVYMPSALDSRCPSGAPPKPPPQSTLLQVFLMPTHLCLVLEYASAGELFESVRDAGRFDEDMARSAPQPQQKRRDGPCQSGISHAPRGKCIDFNPLAVALPDFSLYTKKRCTATRRPAITLLQGTPTRTNDRADSFTFVRASGPGCTQPQRTPICLENTMCHPIPHCKSTHHAPGWCALRFHV